MFPSVQISTEQFSGLKSITVCGYCHNKEHKNTQHNILHRCRQPQCYEAIKDNADADLSNHDVKNIIQPLVENSLFHGLIDEDTSEITGNITISMRTIGDEIEIRVQDNGKGIAPSMLEYLNEPDETLDYLRERGRHIGIANIRQRLFYLYQKNCLHITCDEGTTVILTIPLYHE